MAVARVPVVAAAAVDKFAIVPELRRDPALADVPVVVLSGDGGVATKAESLGVAEYLRKPIEASILMDLARRYIGPA